MAATFAARASLVPSQFHTNLVPGAFFEDIIDVTGDASYPAGGYSFGVAQLQALYGGAYNQLVSVEIVNPWDSGTTSFMAVWIAGTNKIAARAQAVAGAATAQVDVTAATNLSTFKCSIRIRFC